MPTFYESCEECFGSKDLYKILKLDKDANEKDRKSFNILNGSTVTKMRNSFVFSVKKAYYKLSLAVHPDRAPEDKKAHATKCFQVLGKIMAVLSDKEKRAIYDETGTLSNAGRFRNSTSVR